MVVKKIYLILAFLLVFTNFVCAENPYFNLSSEKTVYNLGDSIKVYANVVNPEPNSLSLFFQTLMSDQNGEYPLLIKTHPFELKFEEFKEILIYNFIVDNDLPKGAYTVSAILFEDSYYKLASESLKFEIQGTNPKRNVDFEIKVCESSSCVKESKTFLVSEEVYLNYFSDVENPDVSAILTYPDETTEQISLPFLVDTTEAGTYTLDITLSKEGYVDKTLREQFGVLETEAEIQEADLSGYFVLESSGKSTAILWIVFFVGGLLVILAILVIFFLKKRNQQNLQTNTNPNFSN